MACSAFDKPYVAGARSLLGILGGEFHTLAFAQQFEHGAPHRAAVEEVLNSAFVADKPEALVDQQPSDSAVWHTQALRSDPRGILLPRYSAGPGDQERGATLSGCAPAKASQFSRAEQRNSRQSRQFNAGKSSEADL